MPISRWSGNSIATSRAGSKRLPTAAKGASRLVLATDPDRRKARQSAGTWLELLKKRKSLPASVDRVTFNAITKAAVTEAMTRPRENSISR